MKAFVVAAMLAITSIGIAAPAAADYRPYPHEHRWEQGHHHDHWRARRWEHRREMRDRIERAERRADRAERRANNAERRLEHERWRNGH